MNIFEKIGKKIALLFLIFHYNRTSSHSTNLAFFGISDDKECKFFMKKLDVSKAELIEIVDLLSKADFVRFVQVSNTLFVFLTSKGCAFVLKNQIFGSTFSAKN
jgi:hypothetical protein